VLRLVVYGFQNTRGIFIRVTQYSPKNVRGFADAPRLLSWRVIRKEHGTVLKPAEVERQVTAADVPRVDASMFQFSLVVRYYNYRQYHPWFPGSHMRDLTGDVDNLERQLIASSGQGTPDNHHGWVVIHGGHEVFVYFSDGQTTVHRYPRPSLAQDLADASIGKRTP
jgi:hypothetical protein